MARKKLWLEELSYFPLNHNVKKWKIPDKIGLASQMSKVRIQLIIDQESGN